MDPKKEVLINEYAESVSSDPGELLNRLERVSYMRTLAGSMVSGKVQGRLLSFLSKLRMPKRILEIGTFTGYATLCMAEGLAEDGEIITIEGNEELQFIIKEAFGKHPRGKDIKLMLGDALEIIPELEGEFDFVFIDAAKEQYPEYLELIIDKVSKGGIILADNVLWFGRVLNPSEKNDPRAFILDQFNKKIKEDDRLENFLLPIRDGIQIAVKK